jgi:proteic killer suppression protein
MIYKLIYTESYNKRAAKFLKKHPDLIKQYQKTLELLQLNPQHPSLRLDKLEGKLQDLYSISLNLKYRITIDIIINEAQVIPIDVGDHNQVYA